MCCGSEPEGKEDNGDRRDERGKGEPRAEMRQCKGTLGGKGKGAGVGRGGNSLVPVDSAVCIGIDLGEELWSVVWKEGGQRMMRKERQGGICEEEGS